jgi:hypothetical protein
MSDSESVGVASECCGVDMHDFEELVVDSEGEGDMEQEGALVVVVTKVVAIYSRGKS